jgi:hypothetical protein
MHNEIVRVNETLVVLISKTFISRFKISSHPLSSMPSLEFLIIFELKIKKLSICVFEVESFSDNEIKMTISNRTAGMRCQCRKSNAAYV